MSLFRFASALSRPARTTVGPFVHQQLRRSFADEALLKTALFDLHVELGGKMVPFAGYALPVQYKDGVVDSHLWVRNHAGLFDVSHMGQLRLTGTEAGKFVEHVTVVDLNNLKPNQASLSLITNSKGGIIDDTIVTKGDNYIGMVVNGACKHKDMLHMKTIMSSFKDVQMHYFEDRSLLALQGPTAAEVLKSLIASDINVDAWPFMFQRDITVAGIPCGVTRCGYTGEDGFEISVASTKAVELAKKLLEHKEVKPTGLAVRDSLRLEAGLCLYGHDLNENINPVEGTLMWTISERRRKEGGFLGHSDIMAAIKTVQKKRVGLIVQGAPAREHAPIQNSEGKEIGVITSGSFSPVLKKAISMGYVPTAQAAVGSQVNVVVRGKSSPAVVTKMPFVPNRYHRVK